MVAAAAEVVGVGALPVVVVAAADAADSDRRGAAEATADFWRLRSFEQPLLMHVAGRLS